MKEDKQVRRNITMSEQHSEKAKEIGKGNRSEGIRIALDNYESDTQLLERKEDDV